MKKGFTIVEIIISISLVLIVGVSTTFFIFNNKKNNKLETITREILEAANLYINKEVDEDGTVYKNGILKGAKGLQLSVKNLVDKGYIDEKNVSTLENLLEKNSSELYILASLSAYENSDDVCEEGIINFTPKWNINSDEPIYLCGKNNIVVDDDVSFEDGMYLGDNKCRRYYENNQLIDKWYLDDYNHDFNLGYSLIENSDGNLNITYKETFGNDCLNGNKCKDYDFFYKYDVDSSVSTVSSLSNGFFQINNFNTYVYRGMISNNYIKLGDELFRIVSVMDEGSSDEVEYRFDIIPNDRKLSYDDIVTIINNISTYGGGDVSNKLIDVLGSPWHGIYESDAFYAGLVLNDNVCLCSGDTFMESNNWDNYCGTYLLDSSGFCYEHMKKEDFLNSFITFYFYQLEGTKFTGKGTKDDPYVFSKLTQDDIDAYCWDYADQTR